MEIKRPGDVAEARHRSHCDDVDGRFRRRNKDDLVESVDWRYIRPYMVSVCAEGGRESLLFVVLMKQSK